MVSYKRDQIRSIWYLVCFVGWLIINIRVEAGIGTVLERTFDGLVGGVVLLVSIFLALRFFSDAAEGGQGKGMRRRD